MGPVSSWLPCPWEAYLYGGRDCMLSPLEAGFRSFVEATDLPAIELNVRLAVGARFFEVDGVWREQRVVVELDARSTHGASAFEEDRARDLHLIAHGWRVIRVTLAQLARPQELLGALRLLPAVGSAA